MAIIYVLQGAGNKGKSTTLINVCNKLERKYNKPLTPISYSSANKLIDIKVILTNIKTKNGGILTVGITSQGDVADRIIREINEFLSNNCDIIFSACHLSGNTVDAVNLFHRNNTIDFTQQVIQKNTYNVPNTNQTMQDKCNDCMADHLIDKSGL